MSTERPEFRPLQAAAPRPVWPFALLGAAVVAAVLFVARREPATAEVRPVALGNLASKIEPKEIASALALPGAPEAAKPAESPNVLGGATRGPGMVARSELEREQARSKGAQKQAAGYRKQADELQQRLNEARAQLAALQKARTPPPPSDQEQILQTLAPVLRASSN